MSCRTPGAATYAPAPRAQRDDHAADLPRREATGPRPAPHSPSSFTSIPVSNSAFAFRFGREQIHFRKQAGAGRSCAGAGFSTTRNPFAAASSTAACHGLQRSPPIARATIPRDETPPPDFFQRPAGTNFPFCSGRHGDAGSDPLVRQRSKPCPKGSIGRGMMWSTFNAPPQ